MFPDIDPFVLGAHWQFDLMGRHWDIGTMERHARSCSATARILPGASA